MTRPADDKDWTNLVAGYVLGNLSSEEAASLKQQLSHDPALAQEIVAFQETLSLLPYALSTVEPSNQVKSKLLQAASQTQLELQLEGSQLKADAEKALNRPPLQAVPNAADATLTQPWPSAANAKRANRWPQWVAGISTSIAAVAIAALGLTQIQLHNRSAQTTALQQQLDDKIAEVASLRNQLTETQTVTAFLGESATQVHSLIGPGALAITGDDADNREAIPSARLLAKAGGSDIVFVAQGLPQLAPEQIYRLWAVTDEYAEPMYCGQFRQDASGTARWSAPDESCTDGPSQLLITRDAPNDPITSAGPLVLQSDV